METAADEADVGRIHGTPLAGDTLRQYVLHW